MTSVRSAAGGVELATFLAFCAGKFAEEVFINPPEGIVVHRCGNLGDFLEQFIKKGTREEVVGLGQHTRELRIVLLDVADGIVDRFAHVSGFGQREELIVAGIGCEVEDAFGMIRGGVVHARAATRSGRLGRHG